MTHVDSDQWYYSCTNCFHKSAQAIFKKKLIRTIISFFHFLSQNACFYSIRSLGQPNVEHPTNSGLLHFAIDPYAPGPWLDGTPLTRQKNSNLEFNCVANSSKLMVNDIDLFNLTNNSYIHISFELFHHGEFMRTSYASQLWGLGCCSTGMFFKQLWKYILIYFNIL